MAAQASWQVATSDTQVTLGIADNRRPVILDLRNVGSAHNWAGAGTSVPLMDKVWVGGKETPTKWTFERGNADKKSGTLVLAFHNKSPELELRSVWRGRPGHGPVEHWIEIENKSGGRVTVAHQYSLSLIGLQSGGGKLWWVRRGAANASLQGGTFTEPIGADTKLDLVSNCEDGASPVPWMAVQVGETYGLYVGWEFSGLGHVHAASDGKTLDVNVGNLPDFKTDVEAGETFLVPPAFVGCYAGDIEDGCYTLHRWVIERLRPSMPKGVPDPLLVYNSYMDAGQYNARDEDLLRCARLAHELGFEGFMPDAQWFPATGDWRWDPSRFPSGITPTEEFVHKNGMRMGLWCAWTNGGVSEDPGALSVRGKVGHPDWFRANVAPDWMPGPFWGIQICLGCPPALDWAIKKTQWLVGNHKLDYLKHDMGLIVTTCEQTTHRHHYGVDASYWAAMGYYQVQERLRKAFPNVILENCSGAGHIKDYGIMARTHYIATTDTLSNLPDRQSIYDSTFVLPPLVLQAYTYDRGYGVKGDDPLPFLWRSAMMGTWQIAPTDSKDWTDEERALTKRQVEIYKEWIRPILQDAKIHHILPRPDGVHWDGMFYWSPSLRRGTVYIFRPDSPDGMQTVRLKGLDAAGKCRVWSEDGSVSEGIRTGAELMDQGLTISLPDRYTSDLIYVSVPGD